MNLFNKKEFIEKYNKKIPQIISSKFIADTDTPISALLKISSNQKFSFLLESVEGGTQRGRYSLLGCEPDLVWKIENEKVKIKTDSLYLNENFDLVSGTRYLTGGKTLGGSIIERILSRTANKLFKILTKFPLTDSTTGIKMFKKKISVAFYDYF